MIHRLGRQAYGYQRERRQGRDNWEFGTDIHISIFKIDNQ